MRNFTINLTEEAQNDLLNLPNQSLQDECLDMLQKLSNNINLGRNLENKNGRDLSDCFKIYFANATYRIVYRKVDNTIEIEGILSTEKIAEVLGIGKRDGEYIYKLIAQRLNRENAPSSDV